MSLVSFDRTAKVDPKAEEARSRHKSSAEEGSITSLENVKTKSEAYPIQELYPELFNRVAATQSANLGGIKALGGMSSTAKTEEMFKKTEWLLELQECRDNLMDASPDEIKRLLSMADYAGDKQSHLHRKRTMLKILMLRGKAEAARAKKDINFTTASGRDVLVTEAIGAFRDTLRAAQAAREARDVGASSFD